jgi:hypothetical protein
MARENPYAQDDPENAKQAPLAGFSWKSQRNSTHIS